MRRGDNKKKGESGSSIKRTKKRKKACEIDSNLQHLYPSAKRKKKEKKNERGRRGKMKGER